MKCERNIPYRFLGGGAGEGLFGIKEPLPRKIQRYLDFRIRMMGLAIKTASTMQIRVSGIR